MGSSVIYCSDAVNQGDIPNHGKYDNEPIAFNSWEAAKAWAKANPNRRIKRTSWTGQYAPVPVNKE